MKHVKAGAIPATFYAFPDVSQAIGLKSGNHVIASTEELCDWLLDEHGVATVPGSAFGAPNSIRLSFATSDANLDKVLPQLAGAFASLEQPTVK
jgi:aspartate aminotransferase